MKRLVHHVHFDRFVILVSVAAIVTVVIFFIHPLERLSERRDQMRAKDVRSILAAMVEYQAAHNAELPLGLDTDSTTFQLLGTQAFGCEQRCDAALTLNACLDLTSAVAETGLARLPVDPLNGSDFMTGYAVNVREGGLLDVVACTNEGMKRIEAGQ